MKKGFSGTKNAKGNLGILTGKKKRFNNLYHSLIEIEDSTCIFLMKWKTTYLKKKNKSEHADVYSTKYHVIESSKVWFDIFFAAKWK